MRDNLAQAVETNGTAHIEIDECLGCGTCLDSCDLGLIAFVGTAMSPRIERDKCTGCGECEDMCTTGAIRIVPT